MSGYRRFNAQEMLEYLAEVDEELVLAGADSVRLVAVGGAAMATRRASRMTGDIDIVSEGMSPAVRRACEQVALQRGLAPDWINDGAKGMAVALELEPERLFTGECLVVESAGPRYLLAMKLVAGREADVEDCVQLIRELGLGTSEELLDLVEAALTPRQPSPRVAYWAEKVLEQAL